MSRLLPLFPLKIVVFPGENLNLHIFEPRYKQLINDCIESKCTFGIASMEEQQLTGLGTEIEILNVDKRYESGEMDIRTRGRSAFRITEHFREHNGKLYSAADVQILDNHDLEDKVIKVRLIDHMNELHRLLNPEHPQVFDNSVSSFSIAHKAGLSFRQEVELLGIEHETERQVYLLNHLKQVIPIIAQMENLKVRIKLNGHFRKLSSGDI